MFIAVVDLFRSRSLQPLVMFVAALMVTSPAHVVAQDTASAKSVAAADAASGGYVNAIDVLPESLAGLARIPDLPKFCTAWKQTHAGELFDDPLMQPFIDAQRDRAKSYLQSLDNKIGLKLKDLYEIGSGEAVFAWLPFENDKRRPYALCVVADVRGRVDTAEKVLATLDTDLKNGGWIRTDKQHRGETIRVYNNKPKPGQLKVEQIAIALGKTRIIAADRDSVVTDLIDAIAGSSKGQPISKSDDFRTVLTRAARKIREPAASSKSTVAIEWFARPFQMGRIVRESLDIDRGNQVDILKLLESQGFDAIKAAGGIMVIAGDPFDVLHKAFVLAPAVTDQPDKYKLAARMLQFYNEPMGPIPNWVGKDVASLNRMSLRIEEAFWAAESLVNEAFGDEIFREIIDGILEDPEGPQIDIAKNVLPNLDDRILILTDNTLPAEINSERILGVIRVKDVEAIKLAVRKTMSVEPDASEMDVLPGVEIWRVQRGEGGNEDFNEELFGDLAIEDDEETDEPPPLLDHWAIAVIDQGPGSDAAYLMMSSHPEFLIETAKRIQQNPGDGFGGIEEVKSVFDAMKQLGAAEVSFDRIVRTKLSLRVKYQLLRQGRLKESDTLLASLIRRAFENADEGGEPDPLNAAKLPPLNQIEKHLPEGGNFIEVTEDGWEMTGFFLK